jgi:CRP-like cAMP-binding protein
LSELARIEVIVFLQSVDLFAFCSAEQILRLATIAGERTLAAGDTLYEPRQPAEALYCVVRGEMVVESDGATRRVGPLQTLGVEEILSGRLRAASARADTDCLLLALDAEDFFDLLSHNVEIVKGLFRRLLRPAVAEGAA